MNVSSLQLEADLLLANEKYSDAERLFLLLIENDSLNGEFYFKRGYCLAQIERDLESVVMYEKSIDLGYRLYDSFRNLGILYSLVIGDDSVALYYFKECLKINPSSKDVKDFIEALEKNEAYGT